jgi:hypothetical protein
MLKYQNNVRPTRVTIAVIICHTLFYLLKVGFIFKERNVFEVLIDTE